MLELEGKNPDQPWTLDVHPLEEGDLLEELVDHNRTPAEFVTAMTFDEQDTPISVVLFHIPPEGTQIGDVITGSRSTGYIVESPIGERRGKMETFVVAPGQAERIYQRAAERFYTLYPEQRP